MRKRKKKVVEMLELFLYNYSGIIFYSVKEETSASKEATNLPIFM